MKYRVLHYLVAFTLLSCTKGADDFNNVLGDSSGGIGTASISITSFSPATSDPIIKLNASQLFIVSAVGQGDLLYTWTLDDVVVGSNQASFTLNTSSLTAGLKTLKLTVNDNIGSVTQSWSIKVNAPPTINSFSPNLTTLGSRFEESQNFSVNVTDANNDTLIYVWKLNGEENVLTSTVNSTSWRPNSSQIGTQVITVDVYDGTIGESSTYKESKSWTVNVNSFSQACNDIDNNSESNKSCHYVGISGIGDGLDPLEKPTQINMRPADIILTDDEDMFIADDLNHVVWFWNRNSSPTSSALGVTVPINQIKVVAGVGMANSGNSASTKALRNFFNNPHGLYYDNEYLYVADASNNRVIRINSDGEVSNVITAGCSSPRGIAKFGSNLYITCFSSHAVKLVDSVTLASSTFAGVVGSSGNPAAYTETAFTAGGDGRLNGPYGITTDTSGNVYVSEYTGCRMRMYNTTAASVTLYASYAISPSQQRIILGPIGAASCSIVNGEPVNITGATDARVGNPRHIRFNPAGQLIYGQDSDRIGIVNFAATSATVMGVDVGPYLSSALLGNATAGYIGEGLLPSTTRYTNPFSVLEESSSGDYFIADNGNGRLRKTRATDFKTELVAGQGANLRYASTSGNGSVLADQERMSSLRGLAYDAISGELFMADSTNNRIRVVSKYGVVTQAIGSGAGGSGAEENEVPTNSTMSAPRGMVLTHSTSSFGGHLVWTDSTNHRIRIYNRSTSDQMLFGVNVEAGKVATIGGTGASGTISSGSALQDAFFTPSGVAFDGTNLYVANTGSHCIKKIDASGTLSVIAGLCGTAGTGNGPVASATLSSPEGIDYYENGNHKGLVIASPGATASQSRLKFHRLSGPSLLFQTSIAVGDTNTIACSGTFHTDDINGQLSPCSGVQGVVTVGTSVCFTNNTYHNVRCLAQDGDIKTVMGAMQGIDDTSTTFFPGNSLSSATYSSLDPNYNSQNGVTAYFLPDPIAIPAYNESMGLLTFPLAIEAATSKTLFIGEHNMGFVRKVKIP